MAKEEAGEVHGKSGNLVEEFGLSHRAGDELRSVLSRAEAGWHN